MINSKTILSINRKISLFFASLIFTPIGLLNGFPASAGTYQATCDENKRAIHEAKYPKNAFPDPDDPSPMVPKCVMDLVINNKKITDPYKSIPISRVTSWSVSGESKTDVSGKVAATVAFGIIGLLAADPQKHDYVLVINGYDFEGKKTNINMNFKDGKQPPKLISELSLLTGLGMGQKRTLKDIKKIEKENRSNFIKGEGENYYPESLY